MKKLTALLLFVIPFAMATYAQSEGDIRLEKGTVLKYEASDGISNNLVIITIESVRPKLLFTFENQEIPAIGATKKQSPMHGNVVVGETALKMADHFTTDYYKTWGETPLFFTTTLLLSDTMMASIKRLDDKLAKKPKVADTTTIALYVNNEETPARLGWVALEQTNIILNGTEGHALDVYSLKNSMGDVTLEVNRDAKNPFITALKAGKISMVLTEVTNATVIKE